MKNPKKKNLKFTKDKKELHSIIETIIDTEAIIKIIENNYYQRTMQNVDNADVSINHLENIFRKVLYLSYIENCRLNDICRRLKIDKNQVIALRNKGINHFKHNLEILYKSEKLKDGTKQ